MKASELRAMSGDDLGKTLLTLREAQFKMRMQKATGELGQTHFLQQNPALFPKQRLGSC